jgi:hypothetical protein
MRGRRHRRGRRLSGTKLQAACRCWFVPAASHCEFQALPSSEERKEQGPGAPVGRRPIGRPGAWRSVRAFGVGCRFRGQGGSVRSLVGSCFACSGSGAHFRSVEYPGAALLALRSPHLTMRSSGPRGHAIVFPAVVSARGRLTRR